MPTTFLLDEHVGRMFERVLTERGYDVEQAKDRFGERTSDSELLEWCHENKVIFLTTTARTSNVSTATTTIRDYLNTGAKAPPSRSTEGSE